MDVRVAFCMCAGAASDVRSVECGRATVMRRAVGLSVSNLPAMTTHHFSVVLVFWLLAFALSFLNMVVFALGLSFPLALVQVIDFHVDIMNLMSSRVPLFLRGVQLNESIPDTSARGSGTKIELHL